MFFRQCEKCNERWELGTGSTCKCPNKFVFQTTSNTLTNIWVMKITPDRRIEVNEDVDVTEAAKKVLECMQTMLTKREWVGLTEAEQTRLFTDWDEDEGWGPFIEAIEAKLKEKNT